MLIVVRGTCSVLIFVCKTCCTLIFLFMELVIFFPRETNFFSWNLFWVKFSWNLLRTDVCFWMLLHVGVSLYEIFTLIFLLVKLILFMKLLAWWFFVYGTCCLLIFVLKTCFSPHESDFVHRNCWMLIFFCENCCLLIFVLKTCWFFSSWSL